MKFSSISHSPASPESNSKSLVSSLVIDAIAPAVIYFVLRGRDVQVVPSLIASSVLPVVGVIYELARRRRIDGFGILIAASLILSAGVAVIPGDQRLALAKDASFGLGFGLLCLGSFFADKPLMFYFARKFGSNGSELAVQSWNGYWRKSRGFRRGEYLITAVWTLFSLAQGALVVFAAYSSLSADQVAAVSNFSSIAVNVALVSWSIWYGRARLTPLTKREVIAYDQAGTSVRAE